MQSATPGYDRVVAKYSMFTWYSKGWANLIFCFSRTVLVLVYKLSSALWRPHPSWSMSDCDCDFDCGGGGGDSGGGSGSDSGCSLAALCCCCLFFDDDCCESNDKKKKKEEEEEPPPQEQTRTWTGPELRPGNECILGKLTLESWTKWLPFCWWHFELYLLERRNHIEVSLKFIPKGPVDSISQHWFRYCFGTEASKQYLNTWWASSLIFR